MAILEQEPEQGPRPGWVRFGLPSIVFVVSLAAFWPAADAVLVNWDDDQNLVQNYGFRGLDAEHFAWMWTTGWMGHYQPFTWITYAFDFERTGRAAPTFGNGEAYHATNLVLHALGAVALYFLTRRLLALAFRGAAREPHLSITAALAALLHAVHPLRCESVCWVSERRDVLSGVFFFLALIAYLRARPTGPERPRGWNGAVGVLASVIAAAAAIGSFAWDELANVRLRAAGGPGLAVAVGALALAVHASSRSIEDSGRSRRGRWFALCCAALLASLFSKAWGIVLPALLLVVDVWPLRRLERANLAAGVTRARLGLQLVLEKLPFFALTVVFGRLAYWAQSGQQQTMKSLDEHTLLERAAQGLYGLAFYPLKTLLPTDLIPIYELPEVLSPFAGRFLLPSIAVLVASTALILLARRAPAALAAWLAFIVIASPTLGVLQSGPQLVAERYTYLSCAPFAILVGGGLLAWTGARPTGSSIGYPLAALLVAALASLSWMQSHVWKDSASLWAHTYAVRPDTEVACLNLGLARMNAANVERDPRRRAELFDEAMRLFDEGFAMRNEGQFLINMATLHSLRADHQRGPRQAASLQKALERAEQAIAVMEAKELFNANYYFNHAIVLSRLGRADRAREQFAKAVRVEPSFPKARIGLAGCLVDAARVLAESQPDAALARVDEALEHLSVATSLENQVETWLPFGEARALRMQLLERLGRADEAARARADAIAAYRIVLRLAPGHPGARQRLRQLGAG